MRQVNIRHFAFSAAATLLAATSGLAVADEVYGDWESPPNNNWPLIAVHAALTPDGRVLTYGTWSVINGVNRPEQQTGYFKYDIWDPAAGLGGGHLTLDSARLTDIFCSSQVILPQSGSVFIAGGDNWLGTGTNNQGNNNSNVFNPNGNTLTKTANMNRARWYSSATALVNGEIYIQGGNGGGDRPEVRELDGDFRLLSGADTSPLTATYPRNFLAPDGRVFGFDNAGRMYYVNTAGTGQITMAGQYSSTYAGWTSSAAMYRPGKILQMGGNSNGSIIIDINSGLPIVTPVTELMSSKRQWVSATVMADGRVLATGGSGSDNTLTDVNTSAEIWDPDDGPTGSWTVGPSGQRPRLYHSGALLLPNGSVLITGGGAPGPLYNGLPNQNSEIYYPSYLYSAPDTFAPRPTLNPDLSPDTLEIGVDFTIGVGSNDIRRLTFVKTGSVTHSVNMDQRFIELPFTAASGTLFVQMTDKVTEMPPGYYLMFAFNQAGVPAQAKIVRVNIPSNPVIQLDYTPVIGGSGGGSFQLSCNADETLVGLFGNSAGTNVDRVGLQCIQVDQGGRWIGNPVNRGTAGLATGAAYTKTCPRDFAISGFRGRSGTFVNQLDFQCRALTPAGKVTGTVQYLGAVGGTGGTVTGPHACSTSNPAYAVSGRAGSWLDSFGMQCREARITQVDTNTPPSITNPGNQVGVTAVAVSLQVSATDADPGDTLTYSAAGLPPGLSMSTSGLISGTPNTQGTYPVTINVNDGTVTSSVGLTWTITDAAPLILNPMPKQAPNVFGTPKTYTATVQNAINAEFKWFFDDGTETNWSTSPSVSHSFTRPSIFWVTVRARDARGVEQASTFSQLVHRPLTAAPPLVSGQIAIRNGRLWVVNQDNDTVSVFNTADHQKLAEINVGVAPRALAFAPDGDVWVTNRATSNITVLDPIALAVRRTVALPYGSQPYGLVFAPDGSAGFVALEAAGRVIKLDPVSGVEIGGSFVGDTPRHLSLKSDGSRLYVSRFVTPRLPGESTAGVDTGSAPLFHGGEVLVLDPATMGTTNVVVLRHTEDLDFENQGSGIPNYLGPVVISPDGSSAWVPSKKDNVKRGTLRSGGNLNFQNTVRAISSRIDLATNAESFGARIDHDNASLASAAAFDRYGVFMFVALETSREIAVVNAHDYTEFFRINVGLAPQGVVVSADGYRLYVSNFMDRSIGVYDLTALIDEGQWNVPLLTTLQPVATEKLTPTVLVGKKLFYDARDSRLAREGYMSCASCHNDGGGDGRVWDLTGMGEGLRNTVSLRGKGGMAQGFLHWSANFDEVQDFEGQIRALAGGTGLLSDVVFNQGTRSQPLGDPKAGLSTELDAMAAYLASLNVFAPSPHRAADGSLTADGVAGRAIFQAQGCAQCHGGPNFTESAVATLRNVGTIQQPGSGNRLGAPLTGLDPPTLRGVWESAPYLHNGAAATLEAAVQAHSGVSLGAADLAKLAAYLRQIDGQEPAPPAPSDTTNPVVTITTPTSNPTHSVATSTLNLGGTASDNVGVTQVSWVNDRGGSGNATGTTGWSVSGIALQSGANVLTVTARDAAGNTSTDQLTVSYTPPVDGTAPVVAITTPTSNPTLSVTTTPLSLGGTASDNVGVTLVSWANDRGGSGNATGTTGWSVSGIVLQSGANVLTVTARDAAGNTSTDQLTVTYTPPDTTLPVVTITTPTSNPTHTAAASPMSLGGTASDNVGVTQVSWVNDRGGSGNATGTTGWSVSGIALQGGANVLTVTVRDAAGNTSTDQLTVSYTPPQPAGLVAAYAFDEGTGTTVADQSGNSNAGTLQNGPVWVAGRNGGALQFDGTNDMVTINSSTTLNLTTAMTLQAWIYPTATSGTRDVIIKEGSNVDIYNLYARNWRGMPESNVYISGSNRTAEGATLPANTWTHLAGTYDGTTVRLFVNGAQVSTSAVSGVIATSTGALRIGGNSLWGEYFQGSIDDVRVYNRALSATEIQADMNTPVGGPPPPPDSIAPVISILTPTGGTTHSVSATPLALGGSASDDVAVTQVTWANDRGGSGTATGTTNWSVSSIALQSGQNVLTVTARDAAGNTSTDQLTVTYTPPPDTTNPVVTITTPTSNPTHSVATSTLNLGGTASDNVGVTQVSWVNDRGGSGNATGTTGWSVSGIALQSGANVLTVTARDAAGNTSTDQLTVSYTPPVDGTAPVVAITTPTSNPTLSVTTTPLSLGGTASDNVGVTLVSWANDRGGSGNATGTTGWSVSGIVLQSGANVLTVTARDAAGNTSTDQLTVTYTPPDTTLPVVTITTPTSNPTHTAAASPMSLGGTASDNVGVTQVSWVNDRGGSGNATGTTGWSVSGIALQGGANVLTVTVRDAAGNTSTDQLTVSYTPPPVGAGLVAAYAFNEGTGTTAADASGNANTGTLQNGPVWAAGRNAGALQFDGTNDLMRINDANSIDLTTASTFETWIYPTANQTGWRTILQKEVDAYFFSATTSGGVPATGGTLNGSCCFDLFAPSALPINTWTHIAATYDGTQIRMYVNGVQVASRAASGSYQVTTGPLWLGGSAWYGEHFQGRLDDLRIYNRALSAAEIQADMNTPVGGAP